MNTVKSATSIDQWVFRIAGLFILASVALAHFYSPYWLWFTVFVGLNLLQSSFTGFCPLAILLKKAGVKSGVAFFPNSLK